MRKLTSAAVAAAALVLWAVPGHAAAWLELGAAKRHHAMHLRHAAPVRHARLRVYKPPYYGRAYRPYAYGWAPPYSYNPYGGPYHAAPYPFFPYFGNGWAW